jgi:HTH-type transcriptional regulator/antitoxin HigA
MEAIRPIETEQEYRLALAKMESIFHAIPNTMEGDILELLALAIEEYEEKYYKIEP